MQNLGNIGHVRAMWFRLSAKTVTKPEFTQTNQKAASCLCCSDLGCLLSGRATAIGSL